jgi:hypothetical protein
VPTRNGSFDVYTLYCSCSQPATTSLWSSDDMKPCTIAKPAYSRGYGTFDEIVPLAE